MPSPLSTHPDSRTFLFSERLYKGRTACSAELRPNERPRFTPIPHESHLTPRPVSADSRAMTQSAASGGHPVDERPRLGELLVAMGALRADDLGEALQRQRDTGVPLGRLLVENGYVAAHSVAMALADQHGGLLHTEYGFATGHSDALPEVRRIDVEEPPVADQPLEPLLRLAEPPAPPVVTAELAEPTPPP